MKLNRGSLHYRLAEVYGRGGYEFRNSTDLCSYFWNLALGLFFACCGVLIGVVAGIWLLVAPACWVVLCFQEGHLMPMVPEQMGAFIFWAVGWAMFAFGLYATWRIDNGKNVLPASELIHDLHAAWKDKFCPMIEFGRE